MKYLFPFFDLLVDHKNLLHLKLLMENIQEKLNSDKIITLSYENMTEYYNSLSNTELAETSEAMFKKFSKAILNT
jgi:hypothetical protein